MSTWVSLCTSSCTQSVGTILTEGSSDGLIRRFSCDPDNECDNGLQETFDSREGDSGNIYLTQHVISGTSNLRA